MEQGIFLPEREAYRLKIHPFPKKKNRRSGQVPE